MEFIKEYLLTITAASIICGIVTGLLKKNDTISVMIKMLSGIFLTISILSPMIRLPIRNISLHIDRISTDAEDTVNMGKQIAAEEMKTIIISNTETYILAEAEKLGANIQVDVYLEELIPASVRITGQTAPYTKACLSNYISDNLGIAAEDQHWIE